MDSKTLIAKRVTQEFQDGFVVNLGIGIPTLAANYIPASMNVILQSENGFVGLGEAPQPGKEEPDLVSWLRPPQTALISPSFQR